MFRNVLADSGHGTAGANPKYDRIEIAVHLLENLGRRCQFMGQWIVLVAKLVDEVGVLLFRNAAAQVLVVLRVASANIRTRQHNLGPHRAQVEYFFLAHLVGEDKNQLVALACRDQCESQARIARRRLDQRIARLDVTAFFSLLNHRDSDTILNGAARIHEFEFQEQSAGTRVELSDFEHRRAADHI